MLLATLLNQKNFTRLEYLAAGSICVGLILYSFSDSQESAKWSPFGILLVILSICADSALPNTQESLFRMGATRSEVTYYTNVLVLASMTVTVMGSGDLMGVVRFVGERPGVIPYLGLYIGVSYLAITTHMNSIRVFSAVPTVLLGTARKAMTIVVSFLVFPKPVGVGHAVGTIAVLGGLTISGIGKARKKGSGIGMVKRGRGTSGGG